MNDEVITRAIRPVRHFTIDTGRPYEGFRAEWEEAVPAFSRDEAMKVVAAGGDWKAIRALSDATAIHGFVNFFQFDPSPVLMLAGSSLRGVTYLTSSIILGEQFFRHDPAILLYAPLRMVIAERTNGSATLSFDKPSDLFAVFANDEINAASIVFEHKLVELLRYLAVPVPPELASNG
jgi:uncharacterized protein (DUF302 family)